MTGYLTEANMITLLNAVNNKLTEEKEKDNIMDDKISKKRMLSYIEHIENTGMGREKSFTFIEKFARELDAEEYGISRQTVLFYIENFKNSDKGKVQGLAVLKGYIGCIDEKN